MSLEPSPARLTAGQLDLIQKVLFDQGYTGNLVDGLATDYTAAAKLLIGHVKRGITDRAALATALEDAFGQCVRPSEIDSQ